MAARKPGPDTTEAVDAFLSTLDHPFKAGIEALRRIILDVDPSIAEGIKWKVPSFRTTEYFATTHLRAKEGVGVILHLGAKVKDIGDLGIEDPEGLLTWLAKDRAMVTFKDMADVRSKQSAFETIVRQWIAHVE